MNHKEIKELGNNLMGCGCGMLLLPLAAGVILLGIMIILSMLGVLD